MLFQNPPYMASRELLIPRIATVGTSFNPLPCQAWHGYGVTNAHREEVEVGADGHANAPPPGPPPPRRRRAPISTLIVFPEVTPQRSPNLASSLTFPRRKGGVNTSARLCFCVPTRSKRPCWLCFVHAGRSHASANLPGDSFPATCQNNTLRSTFGTASYRELAGSGTFM
jgi:hypothetical protein